MKGTTGYKYTYGSPQLTLFCTSQDSQSFRILWLLEELSLAYGLEYGVELYARDAVTMRAPPSLTAIHPLGKSPVLVTADGTTIAESSAIATYLLQTYDSAQRFQAATPGAGIRDESLTSFAGATLGPLVGIQLVLELLPKHTPWPFSYLMALLKSGIERQFLTAEFAKNVAYLQDQLGAQSYFMGDEPGRADFMLVYPVDVMAMRGWVDFAKDYPAVEAWRTRCAQREAWKGALNKGNGYDLSVW